MSIHVTEKFVEDGKLFTVVYGKILIIGTFVDIYNCEKTEISYNEPVFSIEEYAGEYTDGFTNDKITKKAERLGRITYERIKSGELPV